jgi:WhiB family transcriptional regulator, redox-sensing transcriptional regulator
MTVTIESLPRHSESLLNTWRDRAACQGEDPELFFLDDQLNIWQAKMVCTRCPVRQNCLEDALNFKEKDQYGVFGGLDATERKNAKRRRTRVHCPFCEAKDIFQESSSQICLACGLIWPN